jgi:hypothetical protein
VKVFTQVKDYCPKVMSRRIIEMVLGVMFRNEAMALRGSCSTMPGISVPCLKV